ncbi:MAG: hypothetical protein NVSMB32_08090 [Actinomycetota bacterium]
MLVGALLAGGGVQVGHADPASADASTAHLKVVFAAIDRTTFHQNIYAADGDGTNIRQISPDDGQDYSWPAWAMGGSRIVYTARRSPYTQESIYLADGDGTHAVRLTSNAWRNGQPKVSPDGRSLIFTSFWKEFPGVAIYRMDLTTFEVTNLSAVFSTHGAFDSDPRFSPDGTKIIFVDGAGQVGSTIPNQVTLMNTDGTGRQLLSHDSFYNTDPALSPDGSKVAISSYRGPGSPARGDREDPFAVKLTDWVLAVRDIAGDTERVLNQPVACASHAPTDPCSPLQAPAYSPLWTPDGHEVGFLGVLSSNTVCICIADMQGGSHPLVANPNLAINWFDWIVPGPTPPGAIVPTVVPPPTSHLLFGGTSEGAPFMAISGPDRWAHEALSTSGLTPVTARWTQDRRRIVFSAKVPFDRSAFNPQPPPPPGQERHVHYTLDFLDKAFHPDVPRTDAALEQIFVMDANGSHLKQLTSPWTEDYMDALPTGDAHGNTDPDISPDGRSVVFTNVSEFTQESAVLRIDLTTGEVYSLTNATAGAMPTQDSQSRFSPDGSQVAFVSTVGRSTQIFVMQTADGRKVRQITDDAFINLYPAWSPDGKTLVATSYRGAGVIAGELDGNGFLNLPATGWQLVTFDVATGAETKLADAPSTPMRPVWSPDGTHIAYVGLDDPKQFDIYVIGRQGGTPRPLQVTLLTQETFVDWR